jgi:hypothetical protein
MNNNRFEQEKDKEQETKEQELLQENNVSIAPTREQLLDEGFHESVVDKVIEDIKSTQERLKGYKLQSQQSHLSSAGTMASTAEITKIDSKEIHSSSAPNKHG